MFFSRGARRVVAPEKDSELVEYFPDYGNRIQNFQTFYKNRRRFPTGVMLRLDRDFA